MTSEAPGMAADHATQPHYREWPGPPGLRGAVACLWHSCLSEPWEQRVLPDGCMDLIWMNGAVHVAGPDTGPFLAAQAPGQTVIGLRFRPGAAPRILGVPAWVLRDRRVQLDELWSSATDGATNGATEVQRIAEAPDQAAAMAAAVAARVTEPDHALEAILIQLRAGSSVASTADALGWTERALHRRCLDAFGYGPSVLRRILRFRTALRLASGGMPFVETASRAGYADQAHLAREVRALAGVPLGQLIRSPRPDTPDTGARHTGHLSATRRA